jgi:hypothetical protein
MDAIIFTKDQFTESSMSKLDTIQSQLSIKADPKKETLRTIIFLLMVYQTYSSTWRDEGKISSSRETKSTTNF